MHTPVCGCNGSLAVSYFASFFFIKLANESNEKKKTHFFDWKGALNIFLLEHRWCICFLRNQFSIF